MSRGNGHSTRAVWALSRQLLKNLGAMKLDDDVAKIAAQIEDSLMLARALRYRRKQLGRA